MDCSVYEHMEDETVHQFLLLLTELTGELFLGEEVLRVHRPFKMFLQGVQDNGLLLLLPHAPSQQHVA